MLDNSLYSSQPTNNDRPMTLKYRVSTLTSFGAAHTWLSDDSLREVFYKHRCDSVSIPDTKVYSDISTAQNSNHGVIEQRLPLIKITDDIWLQVDQHKYSHGYLPGSKCRFCHFKCGRSPSLIQGKDGFTDSINMNNILLPHMNIILHRNLSMVMQLVYNFTEACYLKLRQINHIRSYLTENAKAILDVYGQSLQTSQ